jgi:hypothetical protein
MDEDTVGIIGVEEVVEHEDGSATYTFHFEDETRDKIAEIGLEFILYCAAYKWDVQDALESLKKETDISD